MGGAALLVSCAHLEKPTGIQEQNGRLETLLMARSYSVEELGITLADETGGQTIRWKEAIRPRTPVTLPLLPVEGGLSTQPRIAVTLNSGPPVPVTIDTGAGLNIFEAGLALSNQVKVADPKTFGNVFNGLGGQEFSYYGMFDRVNAGDLSMQNLLTVLRVSGVNDAEVNNVFGLTTLAKFASVAIDYAGGNATFSLDEVTPPAGDRAFSVPLILRPLQLIIEIEINNAYAVKVLLDTGNDAAVMLPQDLIEMFELSAAARAGRSGKFSSIGGTVEARTFLLPVISLNGHKFSSVEATAVPNGYPPSLGSGFLRGFKTTIDFKNGKLWLDQ